MNKVGTVKPTPYFEDKLVSLYCDDSLKVMKALNSDSIDAIVTDPPYGVAFVSSWTKRREKVRNDGFNEWQELMAAWLPEAKRVMKPNACCCCCCGGGGSKTPVTAMFTLQALEYFELIQTLVWKKTIGLGWKYRPSYENILVLAKDRENYAFYDESKACSNVIEGINQLIPTHDQHPTQKPVELMRHLIRTHTKPGDLILDPFAGHFTTGVAAVIEGRRFIGIELNEHYCKVGEARIKRASGIGTDIPRNPIPSGRELAAPLFDFPVPSDDELDFLVEGFGVEI